VRKKKKKGGFCGVVGAQKHGRIKWESREKKRGFKEGEEK